MVINTISSLDHTTKNLPVHTQTWTRTRFKNSTESAALILHNTCLYFIHVLHA